MTKPKNDPQWVFNRVVKHLRKQNAKSVDFLRGKYRCRYFAEDGKRCAAGCLLPLSYKDKIPESLGACTASMIKVWKRLGLLACTNLIQDLQNTHDCYPTTVWEEQFKNVARVYGLKYEPA